MSTETLARRQRLVDEQNTVWQRMQEIMQTAEAENRELTAEERQNWDQAEARLTEVSGDLERLERMAQLGSVDRNQIITTSDRGDDEEADAARYAEAFGLYLRHGMDGLQAEQRQLLQGGFNRLDSRAMATTPDTAGGYLVPDTFRNTMTETMKAYGGLLNICQVITTADGGDLWWPTNDDTGNEGALLSENQQVPEQDMAVGRRELSAYIFTSKLVKLSWKLMRDSAFDIESWLPRKLGERIGRAAAGYLITGSGVKQPEGLVTQVRVGKTGGAGQTTSVVYDDLVDLEHSIDPAYRGQNCRWLMNDQTLKVLRKLKDGDGRPLWVPVPAPGFASTLNGYPYTIDNKMPVPAASAKSIVFGDFQAGYVVRQVQGVTTIRLNERYADYLQSGFFGYAELDGMVDDPSAIAAYEHAAA
ncbi:phage major capsid protein [Streptomyces sp.]|uniref:phage major capsid protein n=1 Tax=Streptomyces sp. TaxID=1931 RepID=UPI002811E051|nr:phage major capsid protein [Streptomyces sp.]